MRGPDPAGSIAGADTRKRTSLHTNSYGTTAEIVTDAFSGGCHRSDQKAPVGAITARCPAQNADVFHVRLSWKRLSRGARRQLIGVILVLVAALL
jgi:hypothetical protein